MTDFLVVDGHEDIAYNALTFGRNYRKSALHTRQAERGSAIPDRFGSTLLGKPEWLLGRVAVIFGTIFTRPAAFSLGQWDSQTYTSAQQAHSIGRSQLDYYHRLVEEDPLFSLIGSRADLDAVVDSWGQPLEQRRIGLVPLMEGADPIREPEELELWAELGLRIVGPSWAATRYAGGTYGGSHGLTAEGHALLEIMAGYNLILDLSHLSHQAFYEALDTFEGRIIASHTNPHRFLPGERGFSDEMIAMVAERNGVIGTVFYNRFLKPGWRRGEARVPVDLVVDVIDHICQVTGSAAHVGLGTDFDGDFGVEHAPAEIDTVADVHRLAGPLRERGFSADDIAAVMGGNWLRVLREALPE